MDKFYCIMNGCEKGQELNKNEMAVFLFENSYELANSGIHNQFAILNKYNESVGDAIIIEEK